MTGRIVQLNYKYSLDKKGDILMMGKLVLVQKAISKVFGDFVAKVVSDGVDALKDAIKDADLDRKSYNQNLQTRLYQLIVDTLNRFTYNKYEKQDKLYDAAESIIKGYIRTQDNVDAVKSGLKMLVSDVSSDTCQAFLETLCGEICSDDNSDLYKEIDMLWKRRESENIRGEFAKIDLNDMEILEQLNDLREVLDFIKRNMNRQEGDKLGHNGFPIVNRAGEYADKWEKNVFLNDFNEEDENAGTNIKLREIYVEECLPHYIWRNNTKSSDRLRNLLTNYIINNNGRKMLLILGQPGIGKSTLITWIMANLVKKKEDILVYQFAIDLDSIDWQRKNVLNDIFSVIGLGCSELENKTLILDGFDEIYTGSDRERILNKLNQELKRLNMLKSFSIIITCRENYVYNLQNIDFDYIVLQAWNEVQIEIFCRTYWEKYGNEISVGKIKKILESKEIFGIPLILYMILALDITIEKSSSFLDVYDQIFSLEKGAIYERCYDSEHRLNDPEIKKYVHQISQKIAFWIFENNDHKAIIYQKNFKEICDNMILEAKDKGEYMLSNTLIGSYFKIKHCEGKLADEVNFVHRSIYEYFVSVYFFESISNLRSKEEVAGKLGELLKDGHLSKQMLDFIKCKFNNGEGKYLLNNIREVFDIMLRDGMTYHVNAKHRNVIIQEMKIFSNMLEIVHLWNPKLGESDKNIVLYLQHNHLSMINLIGADLMETNLNGANLNGANMSGANLSGADLRGANLIEADLSGANLKGADLRRANLSGADLGGANLSGVNLGGANLSEANISKANLVEANLIEANLVGTNLCGANVSGTDLRRVNFRGANLNRVYLRVANLSEADLRRANFKGAFLCNIYLIEADLRGVDLSEAYLSEANLFEAYLSATIFNEEQANILYKNYDLSKSRVLMFKEHEIISYQEYCIRKQKG